MSEINLTTEQQFRIASFNTLIDNESDPEKIRQLAKEVNKHNVVQAATYQNLLKHQWGLTNDPSTPAP